MVGVILYIDRDSLIFLEDLATVYGSIDEAVVSAIKDQHKKIFGGAEDSAEETVYEDRIERLIRMLEDRLRAIQVAPTSVPRGTDLDVALPDLVESGEGGPQEAEVMDLDDVLDSVAVVEFDESDIKTGKEKNKSGEEASNGE